MIRFIFNSYYIIDGTKKRVTFDDDDDVENNETIPPIETDEIEENEDDFTTIDNEQTVSSINRDHF